MGKCEDCGKEIDDKYVFCLDCNRKRKEEKQASGNDIIDKINWNLGAIRKSFEMLLQLMKIDAEKKYGKAMIDKRLKQLEADKEEIKSNL